MEWGWNRLPEPQACTLLDQSQFLPLCAGGQGCHHRRCRVRTTVTITPSSSTKGSQVFTNPPMLQEGKGEGLNVRNQQRQKDGRKTAGIRGRHA